MNVSDLTMVMFESTCIETTPTGRRTLDKQTRMDEARSPHHDQLRGGVYHSQDNGGRLNRLR